jgi:hypothetical protein
VSTRSGGRSRLPASQERGKQAGPGRKFGFTTTSACTNSAACNNDNDDDSIDTPFLVFHNFGKKIQCF